MNTHIGQRQVERVGPTLRRVGANRLAAAVYPHDNVRVLLLHDVHPEDMSSLRTILERLMEQRRPLSPEDLRRMYADPANWRPGRWFAISFDDGLLSSYEAAQEVLEPLDLKAAFFVPTAIFELDSEEKMRSFAVDNVGREASPPPERYRVMTTAHLLALRDQGHAIFPHTHSHMSLAAIHTVAEIERELRAPRAIIEDIVQESAPALAIPFGDDRSVGPVAFRAVEELYDICFTAIPGVNWATSDRYRLGRDGFDPGDPMAHVMNILEGVWDIPYAVKRQRFRRRSLRTR